MKPRLSLATWITLVTAVALGRAKTDLVTRQCVSKTGKEEELMVPARLTDTAMPFPGLKPTPLVYHATQWRKSTLTTSWRRAMETSLGLGTTNTKAKLRRLTQLSIPWESSMQTSTWIDRRNCRALVTTMTRLWQVWSPSTARSSEARCTNSARTLASHSRRTLCHLLTATRQSRTWTRTSTPCIGTLVPQCSAERSRILLRKSGRSKSRSRRQDLVSMSRFLTSPDHNEWKRDESEKWERSNESQR